ncbi:MAG: hypothetical protein NZ551_05705 [Microscillaceae bacterium]|nr:hypothetical protein [Microscillaceae bacterium]MDW8460692.1 hypothetical protein [Cytophagales bacterium]
MRRQLRNSSSVFLLGLLLVIWVACRSTSNHQVYSSAINVRVETLALVDKSLQANYKEHQQTAENLLKELEKFYLYVASIPNNQESTEQWKTVRDNFKGFIQLGEKNQRLEATFARNYSGILSQYFRR